MSSQAFLIEKVIYYEGAHSTLLGHIKKKLKYPFSLLFTVFISLPSQIPTNFRYLFLLPIFFQLFLTSLRPVYFFFHMTSVERLNEK